MPVHWWVEPCLSPLVDRDLFTRLSADDCGLRESLGSWSAYWWGCVPAQLVVCPEATQQYLLGANRSFKSCIYF